ncbi:prepilin-type N-terminal cleavage/methylation domain-containing protein [Halobacillus salinarum]|uniref:ComG operon protein 3 n=1 Tax=Halobacillus salinarum TaxID=2932257 RepID=A0ABY4EDK8_9BACI|nr:competence type IV pilus major pilin ComGC [Halobacillus salinarum]UOQ42534.1 prepilin-type N-terminal cleavage/methylation domain-containing protein [Halobacillus salinarum]
MRNEKGFTLIEMLIVLLIISILLIITIPNITKNNETIRAKGCEALVLTADAQVESYYLENHSYPETLQVLADDGYLKQTTCPNGKELQYDKTTGKVSEPAKEEE